MKSQLITSLFFFAYLSSSAFDYSLGGGSHTWNIWQLGEEGASTFQDTLEVEVKVPTGSEAAKGQQVTVNVLSPVEIGSIKLYNNSSLYSANDTRIVFNFGEDAFIDVNGGLGSIESRQYKNPADGSTDLADRGGMRFYITGLDTTSQYVRMTNAKSLWAGEISVNVRNGHYLYDIADGDYHIGDLMKVAGNSNYDNSQITLRQGNLSTGDLVISENGSSWKGAYDADTNPTSGKFSGAINIEGANVAVNRFSIGNGLYNLVSGQVICLDSYLSFDGGSLTAKGSTLLITDHTKAAQGAKLPESSKTTTFDLINKGQAYFSFGGKQTDGKSDNVFDTSESKTINFDYTTYSVAGSNVVTTGTILMQDKAGQAGGFTVKNTSTGKTGTFNMGAIGKISGVVTLEGVKDGTLNYNQYSNGLEYAGKFVYDAKGTMRILGTNSKFNDLQMRDGDMIVNATATGTSVNNLTILGESTLSVNGDTINPTLTVKNLTINGSRSYGFESALAKNSIKVTDSLKLLSTKETPDLDYEFGRGFAYEVSGDYNKSQWLLTGVKEIFVGHNVKLKNDNSKNTEETPFFVLQQNQVLRGSGMIQNYGGASDWGDRTHYSNMLLRGRIAPCADDGKSAATLHFWGNVLVDNAIFEFDVFGLQDGQYDKIKSQYQTSGYASLENFNTSGPWGFIIFDVTELQEGGILNISDFLLLGNSLSAFNNCEVIFRANDVEYSLAEAKEMGFDINFETGDITFAGMVPEPATLTIIFGSLALCIAFIRRKR